MANYQRCYIRVYQVNGNIEKRKMISKLEELKIENNIHENIYYSNADDSCFEFKFTAKRYPTMIDSIFNLEDYDLWIINADEGGSSDTLRYLTKTNKLFWGFMEKAQYQFTKISMFGETEKLYTRANEIFGHGIQYIERHKKEHGIDIYLKGIYTGNSFHYDNEDGRIVEHQTFNQPELPFKNETAEFWDMLFHVDGIKFKSLFYSQTQNAPTGQNSFPFITKIEFYNNKRLTNILEWTKTRGMPYWKHSSENGFYNLMNPQYYTYNLLNE